MQENDEYDLRERIDSLVTTDGKSIFMFRFSRFPRRMSINCFLKISIFNIEKKGWTTRNTVGDSDVSYDDSYPSSQFSESEINIFQSHDTELRLCTIHIDGLYLYIWKGKRKKRPWKKRPRKKRPGKNVPRKKCLRKKRLRTKRLREETSPVKTLYSEKLSMKYAFVDFVWSSSSIRTHSFIHSFILVGMKHPTVCVLITKMRQELAVDYVKLDQLKTGPSHSAKKRPAYENLQRDLQSLCI